jgi:O-methyltransferase involved in polyketide biosynthesis
VVPYLTEAAIFATLGYVAGLIGGADIVFDYSNSAASLTGDARVAHEARAGLVAEIGEPWVSFFDTASLVARLGEMGFSHVEDLDAACIAARYFPGRAPSAGRHGGHVLHARTTASRRILAPR